MCYASIIGIDVAAEKLDLCVQTDDQSATVTIPYTEAALTDFLAAHPACTPEGCLVGLESTGDYHLKAARFFLAQGFTVKLLNPILTRQYTRTTIRGTKTDKTDAALIVKLVAEGQGNPLTLANLQDTQKVLLRVSGSLTKVSAQLQLQIQSLKRKSLAGTDTLIERLDGLLDEVKTAARETVREATKEPSAEEQFIDSIPGFATKLSAVVHHEIGDITRFTHVKSLVAYAGLDPRIIQSGKRLDTTGKLTKRGSPHLRAALYLAANVARNYDPELKVYYDLKRGQGRARTEVLCMIARKLLARVYTVLKECRCYVIRTV
jgi:transposase